MPKKFFVAAMMIFFAAENFCAAMPASEMFLGGLTVNSSYQEMVRIYGEPTSQKIGIEYMFFYGYGDSVGIDYYSHTNEIQAITVTANNGWKTPSGLAVGDNISKALDICGEPDYKEIGKYKTAYCYFHRSNKGYLDSGFIILFNNSSGKILMLELLGSVSRMANFEEIYQYNMENMVK